MRDTSMDPRINDCGDRYDPARDRSARVIAFLSPYFFWGTVGAITGGILLIAGA